MNNSRREYLIRRELKKATYKEIDSFNMAFPASKNQCWILYVETKSNVDNQVIIITGNTVQQAYVDFWKRWSKFKRLTAFL
jgi:hypothetical protein